MRKWMLVLPVLLISGCGASAEKFWDTAIPVADAIEAGAVVYLDSSGSGRTIVREGAEALARARASLSVGCQAVIDSNLRLLHGDVLSSCQLREKALLGS